MAELTYRAAGNEPAPYNRMADRPAAEERVRHRLFAGAAGEILHPVAVLMDRSVQHGRLPLDSGQFLLLHDTLIDLTRLVGDLRDLAAADALGTPID